MEVSENQMKQRPEAPADPAAASERAPDGHEDKAGVSRGRRVARAAGRGARKVARLLMWIVVLTVIITIITTVVGINRTRVIGPVSGPVVTDFTHLYRIEVGREIAPTAEAQIVEAIRTTSGPVSIGGGRFSMGGQTATEGALHIDMRRYNRILQLDTTAKTVTVQAGATWRQIQEFIDRYGLSIKVMQSYGNFTVGGSLSVNVHGRYAGLGPIISTVRSFRIVLADGTVVDASPTQNSGIFYGAIGGYGGLGVITQATLELADNVPVRRTRVTMPAAEYGAWFRRNVAGREGIVFHNADIYP
ncbi:MAG TPA: FAD-dependent oxidoreductase, partial [Longimicrobium sp.]|nr:FAD-dependent oxidoreductase [Longimicrobium sp.]